MSPDALIVEIQDMASPVRIALKGRDAWAFCELKKAGIDGCTSIDNPAPRWSGYIFKLRKAGLNIETITETHGGAFSGHHARYVLRSNAVIVAGGVA